MATTTTNFGWDIPQSTDLVKDGATAIAALGQDIDTALIDLKGGTTGQILSKASGTDLDYTWITNDVGDITGVTAGTGISGGGTSGAVTVTNSMATAIDAKGDLIAGTGADAFARLGVGSNGQILTADSTETTGLKWVTTTAASGPTFRVYRTANQTISASTWTKIAFNAESWDTAGAFDSTTNYRFTPLTSGYYNITQSTGSTASYIAIYKNGVEYARLNGTSNVQANGSALIYFNGSSDYIEFYIYSTGTTIDGSEERTNASGIWLRA